MDPVDPDPNTLVERIVRHVQVTCQTACSIYVEIKQSIANNNKNQTTVVSYDYKVIFGTIQLRKLWYDSFAEY
jgi:hypothetical protein